MHIILRQIVKLLGNPCLCIMELAYSIMQSSNKSEHNPIFTNLIVNVKLGIKIRLFIYFIIIIKKRSVMQDWETSGTDLNPICVRRPKPHIINYAKKEEIEKII